MQVHEYNSYDEYLIKQTSVSKQKKSRRNLEKHLAVISNIKHEIANMFQGEVKILCVGARNCNEVRAFRQLFPNKPLDITAIDLSGIRSKFSLGYINQWANGCYVHCMDMNKLEFEDDSFDIIYAHHSLEHNPTPQKAAQEFVRVIRNGGLIYITVPLISETTEIECTRFESDVDISWLFSGYIKNILLSKKLYAGDDMAEERELRFAIQVEK